MRTAHRQANRKKTHKLVQLPDGRALNVVMWAGRGVPLVLLHGLLEQGSGWEQIAASTTRPVIAPDLPGFGDSDLPCADHLDAYAADILAALDALKVKKFSLAGHSLGGAVAAVLAEACAARVLSLALMAPVGFGRVLPSEAARIPFACRLFREVLQAAMTKPVVTKLVYSTMIAPGVHPDEALSAALAEHAGRWAEGAEHGVRAIQAAGHADALSRRTLSYKGPVSLLWGSRDLLVPLAHAKAVQRALPQATLTVMDGAGHHAPSDDSTQIASFIAAACAVLKPRAFRLRPV